MWLTSRSGLPSVCSSLPSKHKLQVRTTPTWQPLACMASALTTEPPPQLSSHHFNTTLSSSDRTESLASTWFGYSISADFFFFFRCYYGSFNPKSVSISLNTRPLFLPSRQCYTHLLKWINKHGLSRILQINSPRHLTANTNGVFKLNLITIIVTDSYWTVFFFFPEINASGVFT